MLRAIAWWNGLHRQKRVGWLITALSVGHILYFMKARLFISGPPIEKREWVYFVLAFVGIMLGTINIRMAEMRERNQRILPLGDPSQKPEKMTRIDDRFAALRKERRAGLVTFVMAGDPDPETSLAIVRALPGAGADVIELGMPFTDPMADGPAIQAAGLRALASGADMDATLNLVRGFRKSDDATPIVLMGYFNPIYVYGVDRFLTDAKAAGVDGLIVVDLPPEEDAELCLPAMAAGVNFIRLATPTTDDARLPAVLKNTSGFVYYVSITGITGSAAPDAARVGEAVARIKRHTDLPVAVGFGVRTAEQARALSKSAEAVVVGSALISAIKDSLDASGKTTSRTVPAVAALVGELAQGVRD